MSVSRLEPDAARFRPAPQQPTKVIVQQPYANSLRNQMGQVSTQPGLVVTQNNPDPMPQLPAPQKASSQDIGKGISDFAGRVGSNILGRITQNPVYINQQVTEFNKDPVGKWIDNLALLSVGFVGPATAVKYGATSMVVSQGIKTGATAIEGGDVSKSWLTPKEAVQAFETGVVFGAVGQGVMRGVAAIPKIGSAIVSSGVGRAGINAGIGGVSGYAFSGGNPVEVAKGAAFGAAFSLGSDYVLGPLSNQVKMRLPGVWKATPGEPTIGASGEPVDTFISEPQKSLGGKSLRVVADVTENPAGFNGVTAKSMADEYTGEVVPTGHATLNPGSFSLGKGGETLLKGFPDESAGFRNAKELYHFYSAPGSDDHVNVYGGYAGIGTGESDVAPKVVFGGKSTALVTLDTKVSDFGIAPNENTDAYLSRISGASGETGLAPETVLGKSMERQFITPTKYERFGEELPGSKFISGGKAGTFIIQDLPDGLLGKIPVLRSMFSKYTSIDVYTGSYKAVGSAGGGSKVLDVESYGADYSTPKISVPSNSVPVFSVGVFLGSKGSSSISKTLSSGRVSDFSGLSELLRSNFSFSGPKSPSKSSFSGPLSPSFSGPSYPYPNSGSKSNPFSSSKSISSTNFSTPSFSFDDFKPKRSTLPKTLMGSHGRVKRKYPIKTAKQVLKGLI